MPISTINQNGLTNPLTSVAANTVTSAAATALTLQSAGTTAVTIDTSQNVGIGETTPAGSAGYTQLVVRGASGAELSLKGGTTQYGYVYVDSGGFRIINPQSGASSGTLQFSTSNTERMRITSAGALCIGKTTASGTAQGIFFQPDGVYAFTTSTNASDPLGYFVNANGSPTNGFRFASFRVGTGFTQVGTITTDGSSSTAYNTSSDYRLKENIAPMTGALATVAQLKPCTYTWKVNGSAGQGFIAHELAEVVPDAVSGEKDAVETYTDEDGNEQTRIKPQGVDTSFLVATLTAAIQELKAEFDAYKASHP